MTPYTEYTLCESVFTLCASVLIRMCQCVYAVCALAVPEREDCERPVGFVACVAAQVTSPEVISPDVVQGSVWIQVLQ